MSIIEQVFGASPFKPLLEHARKVNECVGLIRPLVKALTAEDYKEIRSLQDRVSKLEYEADSIKHAIRENIPRRYFLPVERSDLSRYLRMQDRIADAVEDFAVILIIRNTRIHPDFVEEFVEYSEHIISLSNSLMEAAQELVNLAETSFGGEEARKVLDMINGLGEGEWKADRMQREISIHIYEKEETLDPVTIMFYEKILMALSQIANSVENTGDILRMMIVKEG